MRSDAPLDVLSVVKASNLESFDGVNVSTALHKIASFEHIDLGCTTKSYEFISLVTSIPGKISSMAIRNISNILWAFARLYPGYKVDSELLDLLARAMHSHLEENKKLLPQNLSTTLWALATLHYTPRYLLPCIEKRVRELAAKFSPQNLSNTLLSFAKLGYYPSQSTLSSLIDSIHRNIRCFSAQALSNSGWSLSKFGIKDPELYEMISKSSLEILESFNSQNLALVLWGYANIGYNPGESALSVYADASCKQLHGASAQNIVRFFRTLVDVHTI